MSFIPTAERISPNEVAGFHRFHPRGRIQVRGILDRYHGSRMDWTPLQGRRTRLQPRCPTGESSTNLEQAQDRSKDGNWQHGVRDGSGSPGSTGKWDRRQAAALSTLPQVQGWHSTFSEHYRSGKLPLSTLGNGHTGRWTNDTGPSERRMEDAIGGARKVRGGPASTAYRSGDLQHSIQLARHLSRNQQALHPLQGTWSYIYQHGNGRWTAPR